jgi:subtilisin family serine protease
MNRARAWMLGCLALPGVFAQAASAPLADPYSVSSGSWRQPYADQWALARIGWTTALTEAGALAPVTVAVIDTGLDYYHPDIARERLHANDREILNGHDDDGNGYVDDLMGWNFVDGNGNPWDQSGHGTHVTGIFAAATGNGEGIAGIAPHARILPLKVLNFIGRGPSSRVAEAIYYAVGQGARVVNLSLGGELPSKTVMRAVDYAGRNGVLVVAAAGNGGKEVAVPRFLDLPHVITVGASDTDNRRAAFSNFGPAIDVVAPGMDILSLRARRTDVALVAGVENYRPGQNFVGPGAHYYRVNGTSFAAPFVTGAAALILGRQPGLDAPAVKRMIVQSARDIGAPGVDHETGYGLLDVQAALKADPRRFIEARLTDIGVEQRGDKLVVSVKGSARADRFKQAWIEVGQGAEPSRWKRVSKTLAAPVNLGVIDTLPAEAFDAAGRWTLRLIVEHHDGQRREARRALDID